MILKQVHDTNMRAKGYPERVFSVSICVKISLYQNYKQVIFLFMAKSIPLNTTPQGHHNQDGETD